MGKKLSYAFDAGYTLLLGAFILLLSLTFAFLYSAQAISNLEYFIIYGVVLFIGGIYFAAAVAFHVFDVAKNSEAEEVTASAVFISNTTPERPLANWWGRVASTAFLTIIFVLIVLASGSVLPGPSPYSDEPVSKSVLDEHSFLQNSLLIAVVPGISEELITFGLTSILTVLLLLFVSAIFQSKDVRKNSFAIFVCASIAAIPVALLFAWAHSRRGDYTTAAYVLAFVFAFLAQLFNQLTGLFISWIPHIAHNQTYVISTQLSFSVGGTLTAFLPFFNPGFFFKDFYNKLRTDYHSLRILASKRWAA